MDIKKRCIDARLEILKGANKEFQFDTDVKGCQGKLRRRASCLTAVGLENYFSKGCSSGNIPIDIGPMICIKGQFVKAHHSSLGALSKCIVLGLGSLKK